MRVAIVNPFDPLPWESKRRGRYVMLSAELAQRGHQVVWLTADFEHSTKLRRQVRTCNEPNIKIVFVHVPPYKKNISLQRIWSHLVYARGIDKSLRDLHRSTYFDAVVASIPPITAAYNAMSFCAEVKVAGILDMQDAWPHVLELAIPSLLRKLSKLVVFKFIERQVRDSANIASGLVGVSADYLFYLSSFRTRRSQIPEMIFPLGFDTSILSSDLHIQPAEALSSPLVVTYIGTFGRFYDLETVIQAAKLCEERGIRFTLIGDGPKYDSLLRLANHLNLTNTTFIGRMPFDQALPILKRSHLGLVPLTADWPPSVPNKVFDYLALGLPLVFSKLGALELELKKEGIGVNYEPGDAKSLANILIHLDADRVALSNMQDKATPYFRARMDGREIYRQYADFVEKLIRVGK